MLDTVVVVVVAAAAANFYSRVMLSQRCCRCVLRNRSDKVVQDAAIKINL